MKKSSLNDLNISLHQPNGPFCMIPFKLGNSLEEREDLVACKFGGTCSKTPYSRATYIALVPLESFMFFVTPEISLISFFIISESWKPPSIYLFLFYFCNLYPALHCKWGWGGWQQMVNIHSNLKHLKLNNWTMKLMATHSSSIFKNVKSTSDINGPNTHPPSSESPSVCRRA